MVAEEIEVETRYGSVREVVHDSSLVSQCRCALRIDVVDAVVTESLQLKWSSSNAK